jgi:hypothetical protein
MQDIDGAIRYFQRALCCLKRAVVEDGWMVQQHKDAAGSISRRITTDFVDLPHFPSREDDSVYICNEAVIMVLDRDQDFQDADLFHHDGTVIVLFNYALACHHRRDVSAYLRRAMELYDLLFQLGLSSQENASLTAAALNNRAHIAGDCLCCPAESRFSLERLAHLLLAEAKSPGMFSANQWTQLSWNVVLLLQGHAAAQAA